MLHSTTLLLSMLAGQVLEREGQAGTLHPRVILRKLYSQQ